MTWEVIASLIFRYGVPFVEHLIQNSKNNTVVSLESWAALTAKIQTPGYELIPKKIV